MESFITNNSKETQKLGDSLAQKIKAGAVICLRGELGAGKTTFSQGMLKGFGVEGPYTSPTFLVMKEYTPHLNPLLRKEREIDKIYHIDAYRVVAQDILNLGWEEIVSNPKNVIIIEWPERIKKIIPADAWQIDFEWIDENKRKVTFKNK